MKIVKRKIVCVPNSDTNFLVTFLGSVLTEGNAKKTSQFFYSYTNSLVVSYKKVNYQGMTAIVGYSPSGQQGSRAAG